MKLCFISPGYRSIHVLHGDTRHSGGAERQIARTAAFARMGHQVDLTFALQLAILVLPACAPMFVPHPNAGNEKVDRP
jgi:hypothetical protein